MQLLIFCLYSNRPFLHIPFNARVHYRNFLTWLIMKPFPFCHFQHAHCDSEKPHNGYLFLFLPNYIVWISLLSIKITVFDCCSSLSLIPYPLSASFHLIVNGEYWFHLYFCSPLCLSIVWPVSLVPSSVKMVPDSLVLAYSGIKHTIINLSFHPTLPLCHCPPPPKAISESRTFTSQQCNELPTTDSVRRLISSHILPLKGFFLYWCDF